MAVPIDDRLRGNRGAKTVGLAHDPCREDAAAAAARDEEVGRVNEATRDDVIHRGHQVVVVLARVVVVDEIAELLAVARAAARIGIDDDVARRSVRLDLGGESVAVVREGPAVDLENERILPGRVELGRLDDPSLDPPFVEGGFAPELLGGPEFLNAKSASFR